MSKERFVSHENYEGPDRRSITEVKIDLFKVLVPILMTLTLGALGWMATEIRDLRRVTKDSLAVANHYTDNVMARHEAEAKQYKDEIISNRTVFKEIAKDFATMSLAVQRVEDKLDNVIDNDRRKSWPKPVR